MAGNINGATIYPHTSSMDDFATIQQPTVGHKHGMPPHGIYCRPQRCRVMHELVFLFDQRDISHVIQATCHGYATVTAANDNYFSHATSPFICPGLHPKQMRAKSDRQLPSVTH